jgi:endonuclease III related protein
MFSRAESKLLAIYHRLLAMYGQQLWWPADSPFEVMLGAILTQNTNWLNVEKALFNLKKKISLSAEAVLALVPSELEQCIKPAGYFRVKSQRLRAYCRWYLDQGSYKCLHEIDTVSLRAVLLKVHGIGPETADDILLYAFARPVFVIDSYTRRLLQRLQLIQGSENYETLRCLFEANLPKRVSLYKQFHALLVIHAKQRCYKTKPICVSCTLRNDCFWVGLT